MILKGTRVTEDDQETVEFYEAFNRFGSQPDQRRLTSALAETSIGDILAQLTDPPRPLPGHYAEYLSQNREITVMVEAALQVAVATGDPFHLAVTNQGPILQVAVDEDGIVFTVRRLPKDQAENLKAVQPVERLQGDAGLHAQTGG